MFKKVSLRDLNKVYKLEKRTFKSDSFSRKLLQNLIQSNSLFFKLVTPKCQEKLIGYVILIKDDEHRFNLINFIIKKRSQSKGYGSLLLNKTLSVVKEYSNINKVILNVKTTNFKAINLYKKFGFKIVEEIEDYYRRNESAYLMELKI